MKDGKDNIKKTNGHNGSLTSEELGQVSGGKTKTVGKDGFDFICTQCGAVYHDAHTRCKCGSLTFREVMRGQSRTGYA